MARMGELLLVLEYIVTAPGRLLVWFRWAMPNNPDYHDNEFRDDRVWHWAFSAVFYACAWQIVDLPFIERLAEAGVANMMRTVTATFGGR